MFMVLMFTLLPLYYSDNYYNILNDKRDIYWLFSRILFVVIAVSLCISLMLVIKNHQFSKNKRTQLRKISALDVVMLLFGILAIVSTVYSADIGNSISGENAWDVGTQMIVCSVIVYFIISRCYSGKGDLWVYLYFGTAAVLVIGIIDRLGYDFLVMHDEIPLQYNIFISTIGNVNFWAGYLSMLIPFSCWQCCLRKPVCTVFHLSVSACCIFQSVYYTDQHYLHRRRHCHIIHCVVFALQCKTTEKPCG